MFKIFPRLIFLLSDTDINYRGILEGANAIMSKRSMEWDMSTIHPGLILRIGPSSNGPGLLEFIMDGNQERDNIYDRDSEREPSTGNWPGITYDIKTYKKYFW